MQSLSRRDGLRGAAPCWPRPDRRRRPRWSRRNSPRVANQEAGDPPDEHGQGVRPFAAIGPSVAKALLRTQIPARVPATTNNRP